MQNLSKEMLTSIGISSEDADKILAQHAKCNANPVHVEENKVEVIEEQLSKKEELPPPTINNITSIAQLSEYAKGQVVRLPDFAPDQPFVARLKRPSLLVLVKSGKIPNSLLEVASSLFDGKSNVNNNSDNTMSDTYELLEIIAEASLISPTMDEIKNVGIELTDEQLIAIFNYSQQGIDGLKSFRE